MQGFIVSITISAQTMLVFPPTHTDFSNKAFIPLQPEEQQPICCYLSIITALPLHARAD